MSAGPEEQFERMFREHYDDLLRFARRRVEHAQADDVLAETFLTAWRLRHKLPEQVRPWLFRTARNVMLNHDRAARRQHAVAVKIAQNPRDEASDHALSSGGVLDLAAAWRQLAPADQEVIALTAWDQLSDVEAASVLGCTPPALRMRLSRARQRLRAILEGAPPHAPARTTSDAWI